MLLDDWDLDAAGELRGAVVGCRPALRDVDLPGATDPDTG